MKKIDVWKRKIAKEKRKQQQNVWNRLSQTYQNPKNYENIESLIITTMADKIRQEIDEEILEYLKKPQD